MGEVAENVDEIEVEAVESDEAISSESAEEAESQEESTDETTDETADSEIEIIREDTQPQEKLISQQQVDDIVSKRVKRLNSKVEAATESSEQVNAELELAKEKAKLLEIALEQAKEAKSVAKEPNPDDFDLGRDDPEFIKQDREFLTNQIMERVSGTIDKAQETTVNNTAIQANNDALQKKQMAHYEKAEKIGAKDYEATEDIALGIMGNDVANHVIDNFDDSHILMYYLGKNPAEAERITNLIKSQPIKGVAEMGRLSATLKVKPKTSAAPNPDEEIQGESPKIESSGFLKGAKFE